MTTSSTYITNENAFDNAVAKVCGYLSKLDAAIDRKDDEAADKYTDVSEYYIELYAERFGFTYNQFEDACICSRFYGRDIS